MSCSTICSLNPYGGFMMRTTLTLAFAVLTLAACSSKGPSYCSTNTTSGSKSACNATSQANHPLRTNTLASSSSAQHALAPSYLSSEATQLRAYDSGKSNIPERVNHAVVFERGTELMPDEVNETLLPHSRYLVANPHRKVLLTSHLSNRSISVASESLCKDRIDGVVRALLALGVDSSQIVTNKTRLCDTSKNADFVELTY